MPLRYLFVDMNAYFASVEQQDDPRLRGRPVAVVPVAARTTCCLAASYEARKFGVKTGMPVWEALNICPGLQLRVGRHDRYTELHHQIVKAVGRCLPVSAILSVDEMACRLIGRERHPAVANALAARVKFEIRSTVGEVLTCSVGVGPSVTLAKVAADMQKPDGLTMLEDRDLSARLCGLKLTDFPGIGPRMEKRFHKYGVFAVRDLLSLSAAQLSAVWGSKVHGERWFHLLRGVDVPAAPTRRRTVGHSHVLPPDLRTDAGAYAVLVKLVNKAASRLRAAEHWAGALAVGLRYEEGGRWEAGCKVVRCQDTFALLRAFAGLWAGRPKGGQPKQVWMVLLDLVPARAATPSLFPCDRRAEDLSHVLDAVNRQFGKLTVRVGAAWAADDAAPTRIAFNQIPEFDPAFGT